MKILVVPDKFKGTLTAQEAAELIATGWQSVRRDDELTPLPMSDGAMLDRTPRTGSLTRSLTTGQQLLANLRPPGKTPVRRQRTFRDRVITLQKNPYGFDVRLQLLFTEHMDDEEVIAAVRAGDKDAFGALVERYQRTLYYFVVGKVADDTEAKDIVQKSLVASFQNLAEFRADGNYFAWLKGIALNHCRNEWRRYQSQARLAGRLLEEKRAELELASFDARADDGERRTTALRHCLEQLSSDEQTVIELRFVQELPLAAISERLNRGTEAARLLLYRIRQRLAECVKKRLTLDAP